MQGVMQPDKTRQYLLACVASLSAVFIISFITNSIFYLASENSWGGLLIIFLVSFVTTNAAAFALLLWGLPIHYILKKYNKKLLIHYLIFGLVPGIFIVFIFKPLGNDPIVQLMLQASYYGIIGSLSGGTFWYVLVRGNA
jgi:hypothetical protein